MSSDSFTRKEGGREERVSPIACMEFCSTLENIRRALSLGMCWVEKRPGTFQQESPWKRSQESDWRPLRMPKDLFLSAFENGRAGVVIRDSSSRKCAEGMMKERADLQLFFSETTQEELQVEGQAVWQQGSPELKAQEGARSPKRHRSEAISPCAHLNGY